MKKFFLFFIIAFLSLSSIGFAEPWWDTNWQRCRNIIFTGGSSDGDYTNDYWVQTNITGLTFSNLDEIRIVNAPCNSGGSEVERDIISSTATSAEVFFYRNYDTNYSVYYDNPSASSPSITNVFYSATDSNISTYYYEMKRGTGVASYAWYVVNGTDKLDTENLWESNKITLSITTHYNDPSSVYEKYKGNLTYIFEENTTGIFNATVQFYKNCLEWNYNSKTTRRGIDIAWWRGSWSGTQFRVMNTTTGVTYETRTNATDHEWVPINEDEDVYYNYFVGNVKVMLGGMKNGNSSANQTNKARWAGVNQMENKLGLFDGDWKVTNGTQMLYCFMDYDNSEINTHDKYLKPARGRYKAWFYPLTVTIGSEESILPTEEAVAVWHLDEGNGTTASDSSGNGNNGTLNGATWTTGCISDNCLSFDGLNDYVSVQNSASLQLSDSVTISAWVNVRGSTGDHQIIVAKWYEGSSASTLSYILELRPDGITPQTVVNTNIGTETAISNSTIPFDNWIFLTGTYDGSKIKIYVNGTLTGSKNWSGPIIVGNQSLLIGAHTHPSDRNWFNGTIDEVSIYNYAKTPEEILEDYQVFMQDSDGDGIPDFEDACPETYGEFCNGCPEPTCLGCADSYCPGTGEPYCIADDEQCLPTTCPSDGCGVGTCNSDQFGTYTSPENTCELNNSIGTCTNNPCTLTCIFDEVCEMQDRISRLEEQLAETQDKVSLLETTLNNLIQTVNTIQETLINFIEKVTNYLFYLPKGLRQQMLCGSMETTNMTSADGFGLHCEINSKGACNCQATN